MKKTHFLSLLVLTSLSTSAQSKPTKVISMSSLENDHTTQGRVLISAATDLSYGSLTAKSGGDEFESENFNFETGAGLFLIDNLALSAFVSYAREDNKSLLQDELSSSFMMGPSLIYYIGEAQIKPFVQAEYMFGNIREQGIYTKIPRSTGYGAYREDYNNKTKMSGWALGGGVAYFLNHYLSLDVGFAYAEMANNPDETIQEEIKIKGLVADVGFSVYLW